MGHKRAWVVYIEARYGTCLTCHRRPLDLATLTVTQSEVELVKYDLVRHEAFREGEPILAYTGRLGEVFLVDGHTRARVHWDLGEKTIDAFLFTSTEMQVDAELHRIALDAGGGRTMGIAEIPVIDRLGRGTEAWETYRAELLKGWLAERRRSEDGRNPE